MSIEKEKEAYLTGTVVERKRHVGERTPGAGSDWTSYNEGDREHGHAYSMVGKREEYKSSRT